MNFIACWNESLQQPEKRSRVCPFPEGKAPAWDRWAGTVLQQPGPNSNWTARRTYSPETLKNNPNTPWSSALGFLCSPAAAALLFPSSSLQQDCSSSRCSLTAVYCSTFEEAAKGNAHGNYFLNHTKRPWAMNLILKDLATYKHPSLLVQLSRALHWKAFACWFW